MNRADHAGAEQIRQVGRDGGEAAAVHRDVDAEEADEQREAAGSRGPRNRCVEDGSQHEERGVGHLAPDPIRQRCPEDAAENVEQRQQAREGGAEGGDLRLLFGRQLIEGRVDADQLAAEDFLQQRGGESEDADSGGDVQAQDGPRQPELRRPHGHVEMHVIRSCERGRRRRRWIPFGWLPPIRGQPVSQGPADHEHEVDGGERQERLPDAHRGGGRVVLDEPVRERRADHRPAPESHDGHAGRHAAPVREPLDERGDR